MQENVNLRKQAYEFKLHSSLEDGGEKTSMLEFWPQSTDTDSILLEEWPQQSIEPKGCMESLLEGAGAGSLKEEVRAWER